MSFPTMLSADQVAHDHHNHGNLAHSNL